MRSLLLALLIILGTAIPADAQDPDTEITAAQRKQLAAMLDTVRNAERVEALPLQGKGNGLSATYRVVEKPVAVESATDGALRRLLAGHDWTSRSPMICTFQPGVAFRFLRGSEATVVQVCFMCGEMAFDGIRGPFGQKKMLEPAERNAFLRAAKKAFPKKFDQFDEEDPDIKSK